MSGSRVHLHAEKALLVSMAVLFMGQVPTGLVSGSESNAHGAPGRLRWSARTAAKNTWSGWEING